MTGTNQSLTALVNLGWDTLTDSAYNMRKEYVKFECKQSFDVMGGPCKESTGAVLKMELVPHYR